MGKREHVAVIGLEAADPTIPWPARGSAEKVLCEREGWERRTIPVVNDGVQTTVEAMVRGELAVNLMMGGEEGFAICLASTGWRISSGGRVYATCTAAMCVAEEMMEACAGWEGAQRGGYTAAMRCAVIAATDAAERRGEILLDRVYPR